MSKKCSTFAAAKVNKQILAQMATLTLQVPNSQVGWLEQMARAMRWTFHKVESPVVEEINDANVITPSMRRHINKARKEYAEGKTISCKTPQEMQQFFDSL